VAKALVERPLLKPGEFGAPLVYVRMDAFYERCRRRGRFAIPKIEAASLRHLEAAVKAMQEKMVAGLKTVGYRYVDEDWGFRGPYKHVVFSDDITLDSGPVGRPQMDRLHDPEAWAKWERAEKARVARRLGAQLEMVDYELVATFEKRVPGPMGVLRTQKRSN
jgi:hypothetical protein